jgi:hypothetical protein
MSSAQVRNRGHRNIRPTNPFDVCNIKSPRTSKATPEHQRPHVHNAACLKTLTATKADSLNAALSP